MALTIMEQPATLPLHYTKYDEPPPPPPPIVITPCDPWPRPYYLERGLRRVAPYHYTYNTYCKQRWRGREILDIFASEFRDRPREYYKRAIEEGLVVLNGKRCNTLHDVVKNGDVISHTLHRHEPPVTAALIGVISEDNDMIVIDKPAGVPVHPAGRYNYNSVVEIMRAERGGGWNPLPCNRLDRLTSGVMFIGKNSVAAEDLSEKLRGRTVRKEYLARVKGRFPDGDNGMPVKCEEAILQISPILGLNRARASGKSAKTLFRRLAYYPPKQKANGTPIPQVEGEQSEVMSSQQNSPIDASRPATPPPPPASTESEGYSIVQCLPLTGRTHQLRVHLQFLGHPISNDPIYSNRRVFGPGLARHDSSPSYDAEIISRLSQMGKTETASSYEAELEARGEGPAYEASGELKEFVKMHDEMVEEYNRKKGEKMTGKQCELCGTELYSDPSVQELGIYLHAVAYSDTEGKWAYQSPMPSWAMPPDGFEGPKEYQIWDGPEDV